MGNAKKITAAQAQADFGRVLQGVCQGGEDYVVEQDGAPIAAVVPYWLYEQWQQRRETFFERVSEVAKRVNMDSGEAEALVAEAVKAVRDKIGADQERPQ